MTTSPAIDGKSPSAWADWLEAFFEQYGFNLDPLRPEYELLEFRLKGSKETFKKGAVIVIPRLVYILSEDFTHKGEAYRSGEILSRNLALTRKNGGEEHDPSQWTFSRYKNAWDALRAFQLIPKSYREKEIPRLEELSESIDFLLDLAFQSESEEEMDAFDSMVRSTAADLRLVRDEDKEAARDRIDTLMIRDSRGRRNPQRLTWMTPLPKEHLKARAERAEQIGVRFDDRSMFFAAFVDTHLRVYRRTLAAIDKLQTEIENDAVDEDDRAARVHDMRHFSSSLSFVHMRPFGSMSMRYVKAELEDAAYLFSNGVDEEVADLLDRSRRSIQLVFLRSRLEQISTALSHAKHLKRDLSFSAWNRLAVALEKIRYEISGSELEAGFKNPVLSVVRDNLDGVLDAIREGGPNRLKATHHALKAAAKPI